MLGTALKTTLVVALVGVLTPAAAPGADLTSAQSETAIAVEATATNGTIAVSGQLSLGSDQLEPKTVVTDPAGDALVPGIGMDMTGLAVATDLDARRVTFTLSIADGIEAIDGNAPGTGYQIAFDVDGQDHRLWLGAGSAGTNYPPADEPWVALCHSPTGWACPAPVAGGITAEAVTWVLPFDLPVGETDLGPGSVVEPGTTICGTKPCSFPWPSTCVCGPYAPIDRLDPWVGYQVPGEVLVGIGPAGLPEWRVEYTEAVSADVETGAFAASLPAPDAPGEYTVFARTCSGRVDDPICAYATTDVETR